jgi:hypothetical protein
MCIQYILLKDENVNHLFSERTTETGVEKLFCCFSKTTQRLFDRIYVGYNQVLLKPVR